MNAHIITGDTRTNKNLHMSKILKETSGKRDRARRRAREKKREEDIV